LRSHSNAVDEKVTTDTKSMPLTLLARNKRPLYSRDNEHSPVITSKPWNDPNFLSDADSREKQNWLTAMLETTIQPDIHAFALVLQSIATWKHGSAPKRAEHWMSRLKASFPEAREEATVSTDSDTKHEKATTFVQEYLRCHLYTVQAWAYAEAEDPIISVNRAEAWLNKAKIVAARVPAKQIQSILTECHNAFLDGCSRGKQSRINRNSSEIHAERAEATLNDMVKQYKRLGSDAPVQPNTESVNFVMRAFIRCPKDASIALRCKALLDWMEESDEKQHRGNSRALSIRPNARSYSLWLNSLAIVAQLKSRRSVRNLDMSSEPRDDVSEELKTLEVAVEHMKDLFQRGRLEIIENNSPYNILLSAWAGVAGPTKRLDAPMQAEKIFRTMVDLKDNHDFPEVAPDAATYFQVIRTWAKSGSDRAGERANWWLDQQWKDYNETDNKNLLPTTHTYTTAISAWSKTGNPEKAEELLLQCLEHYERLKVPELELNTEIYATIIQAWLNAAESQDIDQAARVRALNRAVEWLESLVKEESDSGPATRHDIFLNTLKAARGCAKDNPGVLDTASRVFKHLRNSRHHVHPIAYYSLLQVGLSALSKPEHDLSRTKFLTELATVCCEDGFLSRTFVLSLTNGPIVKEGWSAYESARISEILFPHWPISPAWTRNLQRETDMPRKEDFQRTRFKFDNQDY